MAGDSYENALRAARELWMVDSLDYARREVLDRLDARRGWMDRLLLAKVIDRGWLKEMDRLANLELDRLKFGLCVGFGWIRLEVPTPPASADENWHPDRVS